MVVRYSLFESLGALFLLENINMADEQTFIMIKPDAVHRGLVGEIVKRFEQKGFKLVAMKFMWVSKP